MQDDWAEWLLLAKFSANNQINKSTNMSLFFSNYSLHPAAHFDLDSGSLESTLPNVDVTTLASVIFKIIGFLHAEMGHA